jgi:hypothetical protein
VPHKPSAGLDYDYEERAAILEFEAGYPRDEAERRAREMSLCDHCGLLFSEFNERCAGHANR